MINQSVKKVIILTILFIFMSGVLLFNPVSAKTINLSFSCATPDAAPLTKRMLKPWAKKVEEATDGQVKITMYTGGSLVSGTGALDGVSSGLTDIAWVCYVNFPNRAPLINSLAVPGINYTNNKVASYVDWSFIRKYPESVGKDVKFMYCFSGAVPGGLLSKKPVTNLDDLKGMQVRSTGVAGDAFKALGVTPVSMSMGEAYEALSKSVIDAVQAGPEPLDGWKLAEVTDYYIRAPFIYNSMTSVVMNKDKWNSLPKDIQETIEQVNKEFFDEVASEEFGYVHMESLEYGLKNGIKFIEITGDEVDKWQSLIAPVREEYIKKLNDKGLPGTEAFETIEELYEKYSEEFKDFEEQQLEKQKELIEKYDAYYNG